MAVGYLRLNLGQKTKRLILSMPLSVTKKFVNWLRIGRVRFIIYAIRHLEHGLALGHRRIRIKFGLVKQVSKFVFLILRLPW
jgi:hypothetical protein